MSAPAVEARGLTLRYGDFLAVDHLDFTVETGEVFGFLGANGAGKTTTIRMLCGLLTPTEGTARVAGFGFEDGGLQIKAHVGYMSQRFTLYNDMTVEENLRFTAALRRLSAPVYEGRVKELLDFIAFSQPMNTLVRDLPGGVKQQLALAAALLHDPDVLFLDEPTAGVAPATRRRFWGLIQGVAARGKTVFVTTHYMDEAEQCGRIALMRSGRIIALDTPAGLKRGAFPEPLYELAVTAEAPSDWMDQVRQVAPLESLVPYGLRAHATLPKGTAADVWAQIPWLSAAPITPSLEDVFVRLVEGAAR